MSGYSTVISDQFVLQGSVELGDSSPSYQTKAEKVKSQPAPGSLGYTNRFLGDRSMNEFFHR